ncbi:300_t:CDS:2, partial [Funneliformis geosporum]
DSDSTFVSRRRVNRYKNRPKPNINPPDDNSEQSVDEPSESSEYTTEEDNISDYETFENYAPPDYEPFQDLPDLGSIIDNRRLEISEQYENPGSLLNRKSELTTRLGIIYGKEN